MMNAIPIAEELRTLIELEQAIERGLQSYIEVGESLAEINGRRLYREQGFSTFEEYCKERWGLARRSAYERIDAAEVVQNVRSSAQSQPSFTQARELAVLTPEQQREVASRVDFGKTTVRGLQEEIQRVREPEGRLAVHFSSATEEWYTPPEIVACALKALGGIDLDPCSNSGGKPNIPAAHYFTQADDGLTHAWAGRVYMNPPYGRVIEKWVDKLVTEYRAGRTSEAIALVPARTDTDWFRAFRDFAVCFIDGRLKFSGHDNSAPFPSAVIYLGGNIDVFFDAFSALGDVWIRWQH